MAEDSSKKNNKKFSVGGNGGVGELPPSPTTSTSKSTKRPTRHHVKRRSSGRVHVTKLAPMARAAAGEEDDRKSLKRSHSQKSLSRLPSNDRRMPVAGFTSATSNSNSNSNNNNNSGGSSGEEEDAAPHSPPSTPPLENKRNGNNKMGNNNNNNNNNNSNNNSSNNNVAKRKPSLTISNTCLPAAPVEHTLSVTADNLISSDNKKAKNIIFSNTNNGQTFLKSQFVISPQSNNLLESEEEEEEKGEMTQVDQWLEKLTQEYQCVKQHRDPMRESLIRCQEQQQQKQQKQQQQHKRPNHQNHQRAMSYSVFERNVATPPSPSSSSTSSTSSSQERRHQVLLKMALQRQQQENDSRVNRWTTGTFLDRLLYG